jgi:hypothetical protein
MKSIFGGFNLICNSKEMCTSAALPLYNIHYRGFLSQMNLILVEQPYVYFFFLILCSFKQFLAPLIYVNNLVAVFPVKAFLFCFCHSVHLIHWLSYIPFFDGM